MGNNIEKIRSYVLGVIDKVIVKTDNFIKRIDGMEKDLDAIESRLEKGDAEGAERKRREVLEKAKEEYKFANQMITEMGEMGKKAELIEKHEEEKDKIERLVEGDAISLGNLIRFIEFNDGDDEEILGNITGKQLYYKGQKLAILDYNYGVISIEGLGSIDVSRLKSAIQQHIMEKEGINVDEAMQMVKETSDEEELRKFFRNKILKHKDYQAKIYDFRNMMFHLIIRADDKFVHGWIPANVHALDRAVDLLSRYRNEHINMKLEQLKPMNVTSLAQLEARSPEFRKRFLEALPKWRQFKQSDAEIIGDILSLRMKEAGVERTKV